MTCWYDVRGCECACVRHNFIRFKLYQLIPSLWIISSNYMFLVADHLFVIFVLSFPIKDFDLNQMTLFLLISKKLRTHYFLVWICFALKLNNKFFWKKKLFSRLSFWSDNNHIYLFWMWVQIVRKHFVDLDR